MDEQAQPKAEQEPKSLTIIMGQQGGIGLQVSGNLTMAEVASMMWQANTMLGADFANMVQRARQQQQDNGIIIAQDVPVSVLNRMNGKRAA